MATPIEDEAAHLSRAVSDIDLRAALTEIQSNIETGVEKRKSCPKYSTEEIISLRTGTEKDLINHAEFDYISRPKLHDVPSPHYLACPRVPPPTPAGPETTPQVVGDAEPLGVEKNVTAPSDAKKKKKSSGKNKKAPPTGFEEFYADPPITPDEHTEEVWLYGEAYPFAERIETCIQRYRARRKLDEVRSNILTKYLMLGGVESSVKAFTGGLDKETIAKSTAAEIAAIQATDYVLQGPSLNSKYYDGSKDWVVDFEGVAKGFFSYRVPSMFLISDEKQLQTITAVVRNFLNYVLLHAVCPEYTEDVMAARRVCDLAEKELWTIKLIQQKMPGEFNVAASTIYGGRWEPRDDSKTSAWDTENGFEEITGIQRGLTIPEAERIFKTCVALATDDNNPLFEAVSEPGVHIVKSENKSYEVVAIERADNLRVAQFESVKGINGEAGAIKPVGLIRFRPWKGTRVEEDPEAEKLANAPAGEKAIESFWLDDEILELCYVGLKLEVVVHTLNFGFKFFDTVKGAYCSFFTYLENEKMMNWKEPYPVARPPPTEDDPDSEERVLAAEAANES